MEDKNKTKDKAVEKSNIDKNKLFIKQKNTENKLLEKLLIKINETNSK